MCNVLSSNIAMYDAEGEMGVICGTHYVIQCYSSIYDDTSEEGTIYNNTGIGDATYDDNGEGAISMRLQL